MAINNDDDKNYIEMYWRSRVMHLSKFFNGLTGLFLSNISTYKMNNRSLRRAPSSEKEKETIVLAIVILLSVTMGSSTIGRLNTMRKTPNIVDMKIHSGFWEVVPEYESRSKVFKVENPTEYPLILDLKTLNFVPVTSSILSKVTWDYNGEPLLPGELVEIEITLENYSQDYYLYAYLDIHVVGFISDRM